MQPYPDNPHDWALWLFKELENIQRTDSHWQGVIPTALVFDDIVRLLPKELIGPTNQTTRTVEFHPAHCNVFGSMDELVMGARRREALGLFTVRELNYTHGRSQTVQPIISNYLDAVRLWKLLVSFSDYQREQSIIFIKTFEAKIEIRAEYSAQDLAKLGNLCSFATEYFESEHHREQKRNIVRASLLEVFKGELKVIFSSLLAKFDDFVDRVKASYSLYTADFSFEKLRLEVEKQNVDDTLRVNKIFSDIQNQLLALPAALMIAGAGVKDGIWSTNLAIFIGLTVFVWVMRQLIKNQQNSVNSIDSEVQLRVQRVKLQPVDISTKVLPLFESLTDRIVSQRRVLRNVWLAVWLVWLVATVMVAHAQFPGVFRAALAAIFTSGFE